MKIPTLITKYQPEIKEDGTVLYSFSKFMPVYEDEEISLRFKFATRWSPIKVAIRRLFAKA